MTLRLSLITDQFLTSLLLGKYSNNWSSKELKVLLPTLTIDQHGLFPGHSTTTNALVFSSFICDVFNKSTQVDTIFMDFSKVLESVDHFNLVYILDKLGIGKPLFYSGSTRI